MPIAVTISRPKLDQTNSIMENIDVGTAATIADEVELRVFLDGITIDTEAIVDLSIAPITWTAAGTQITGIAGSFSNVREGDLITSTNGTDFASTQAVTAVAADGSTVDFAPAADGDGDSGQGAATLTFTPGDIDATLYYIRLKHTVAGSVLSVTPRISCMDGTGAIEGGTADDSDDVVFADGTIKNYAASTINLDAFLSNARIARTN